MIKHSSNEIVHYMFTPEMRLFGSIDLCHKLSIKLPCGHGHGRFLRHVWLKNSAIHYHNNFRINSIQLKIAVDNQLIIHYPLSKRCSQLSLNDLKRSIWNINLTKILRDVHISHQFLLALFLQNLTIMNFKIACVISSYTMKINTIVFLNTSMFYRREQNKGICLKHRYFYFLG